MSPVDQSVSPGIGGFLAFFLLACALWLLMRNMLTHMRRVDFREEEEERRRAREEGEAMSTRPPRAAGEPAEKDVEEATGATDETDETDETGATGERSARQDPREVQGDDGTAGAAGPADRA